MMEGILWKWTNYFNGWQQRWFILEDGILSYYKNEEDVCIGCKGSINMTVCDVSVHATDKCRLDLIVPSEAHFYLKTSTALERQQWLVSLGSCKASHDENTLLSCSIQRRKSSSSYKVYFMTFFPANNIESDLLKQKKSELRLYSDLLMQQVHSLKTVARDVHRNDPQTTDERLDEATQLLSATCDTFIHTLDACLHAAHLHSETLSDLLSLDEEPVVPPSSPRRPLRIKVG